MSKIAADFYGNPSEKMKVFGITGTNGKTSIAHILHHILNQNYETFYIPAPRGEILDLNGNKLAESILEPYLFLNQKKINAENITIYKQFISFNFNDLTNTEIDNFFSSKELFVEIANLNDYETDLRIKIQEYVL